jgi:hypothetical protein
LVAVLEMSQSSYLAAGVVSGINRRPLKKLDPDPKVLLRLVERWRDQAVQAGVGGEFVKRESACCALATGYQWAG